MPPSCRSLCVLACIGLGAGVGIGVAAQTLPDAGALLRQAERTPPVPPARPAEPALRTPDDGRSTRAAGGPRFVVKAFRFEGVSLLEAADVDHALAPWLGRKIGFADLEQAGLAVAEAYRRAGWFARVQLPAQDISDGTVRFEIIEGRLGKIVLDTGGQPLRTSRALIDDMLTARQRPGAALRLDDLERATTLLNDTPGVRVEASLAPGSATGESDLLVSVRDTPRWAGSVLLDNQGVRSTGTARLGLNLALNGPSGRGDQGLLGVIASEGSAYLRGAYSLPLGGDGARVGVNASAMRYHLVGADFEALDARGTAQTLGATASYPLRRSAAGNIGATLAFDSRAYRNTAGGIETSRKRADTLALTLNGDAGGDPGGYWLWSLALAAGRLDLSGNGGSEAADAAGPRAQGRFVKLNASLARLQRLTHTTALWFSVTGQASNRNLDSSEKFSLGGAYGVRAYPSLEASGDSGWFASAELRRSLHPDWQAVLFCDHGAVQLDHSGYNGAASPNTYGLTGCGVALNGALPGGIGVRAALARRLHSNPAANAATGNDADGTHRLTRLWLSAVKSF